MSYGFVYITTNLLNNQQYVGKRVIKNNKKDSTYLGSGKIIRLAIKKNGVENFKREILCYCDSEEDLKLKELEFIQKINCIYPYGYNIAESNCGGDMMKNHPQKEEINKKRLEKVRSAVRDEEWRKNMSSITKGRKHTPETINKIKESKAKNPYTHNPERREKLSSINKGRKDSPETCAKRSASMKGKKKSPEHIEKVRQALKGRKRPQWVIDKVANSLRGKKLSAEIKLQRKQKLEHLKILCDHCNKWFHPWNFKQHIKKITKK